MTIVGIYQEPCISVDSNDMMYASDPKYVNEVKTMINTLVNEILSHLKTLASPEVCWIPDVKTIIKTLASPEVCWIPDVKTIINYLPSTEVCCIPDKNKLLKH